MVPGFTFLLLYLDVKRGNSLHKSYKKEEVVIYTVKKKVWKH